MSRDSFMESLRNLMRDGVARAVLNVVDDEGNMQRVQISLLEDEVIDGVERFQNYGFTSVPEEGTEATVVFVGADRSHPVVVVADDRRVRKKGLKPGEVAVYHKNGDFIHLKNENEIEVKTKTFNVNCTTATLSASSEITLDTPLVTLTGRQQTTGKKSGGGASTFVGGLENTGGEVISNGVSLEHHTHPGDSGGTTGEPQ
ncbi:phage baseplate assembly protein V [uncultured Mailhella sp.]|uniref:phage baseplate assembly protein V n=1 Tax=uncultured Mailhella sp. TaxID=1981031 RepID=UPI0025F7F4F4|nr:phage baseplate assembly protein V [uncultured Mailhella sp.]